MRRKLNRVPVQKLLIANRGEIACRISRTAKRMGIKCVSVFTLSDKESKHTAVSNEAYMIGSCEKTSSYMNSESLLELAKQCKADAVHPGYGYLSENASFIKAVEKQKLKFIGPKSSVVRLMGDKQRCNQFVKGLGIPILQGYYGRKQNLSKLLAAGKVIGYPLVIKPALGGGGRGIKLVLHEKELEKSLDQAQREAKALFGSQRVILEKYLARYRHIEVQIARDEHGNSVHLYDRECTVQRRNQKIVEEAPARVPQFLRISMHRAAKRIIESVKYTGIGTVEFLLDNERKSFYFLEMNTRIQVEHPVTESIVKVKGKPIDLVEIQILIARGEPLPFKQSQVGVAGSSIEARLYAENASENFTPCSGQILDVQWGSRVADSNSIRIDTSIVKGEMIQADHDPLIAKIVSRSSTRPGAIALLIDSLHKVSIVGVMTNKNFLLRCLRMKDFKSGKYQSDFVSKHMSHLCKIERISVRMHKISVFTADALLMHRLHTGLPRSFVQMRVNALAARYPTFVFTDHLQRRDCDVGVRRKTYDITGLEVYDIFDAQKVYGRHEECGDSSSRMEIGMKHDAIQLHENFGNDISMYRIELLIDAKEKLQLQCIIKATADVESFHVLFPDGTLVTLDYRNPQLESEHHEQQSENHRDIVAPITGRVSKILVPEGASIVKGQLILLLHAMKMEFEVRCGASGRISLKVEEGSVVQAKQVIAEVMN